MPTKPTVAPQIYAWSYSRLKDYENCPLKAKLKHVDKIAEPGSEAMDNGNRVHKLAEAYATGKLKKLPIELINFKAEFAELLKRKKTLSVEQQLAFGKTWAPASWFGKDAWVRVVIDVWYVEGKSAVVVDHKTGKVRPENMDQLSLYAIAAMETDRNVEDVKATLWYLDAGEDPSEMFTRSQLPKLKAYWEKRSLPMLRDQTFAPTPNRLCGWCFYSKAKDKEAGRTESLCQY